MGNYADYLATVGRWELALRRGLLAAHAAPMLLGLIAVLAARREGVLGTVDVGVWVGVFGWTTFLLVAGWWRAEEEERLLAWVMADAAVMAALEFVGTPARSVVNYVVIDGALFATVFLSTFVALAHVGVAYSGLVVGRLASEHGASIPTPPEGWGTSLVVTLAAVIAFGFVRVILRALRAAAAGHQIVASQQTRLARETASRRAVETAVVTIETSLTPVVARLGRLAEHYGATVGRGPGRAEAMWLTACVEQARSDLLGLRGALDTLDEHSVEEAIDTGILGATAARLLAVQIVRELDESASRIVLQPHLGIAITEFVREAITNGLTHGRPPVIVGASIEAGGVLEVWVIDSGEGYAHGVVTRGQGLDGIGETAALVGAEVVVRGRTARGNQIALRMGIGQ